MTRVDIPLKCIGNRKLYMNSKRFQILKEDLEQFLDGEKYMNSKTFSKKVLLSHEVQSNNIVEGYGDDVQIVKDIINNNINPKDPQKRQRILNLYYGYKYILENNQIDQEHLKELYSILSKDLLSQYDLSHMGEYYRDDDVYIFFSNRLDAKYDMGLEPKYIKEYMDGFFDYININNDLNTPTDYYIKSQVMHYYMVYIHPYYDINGRTARTMSMWYLLNNKVYPYVIFNRAIQLEKNKYYEVIRDVKKYCNISYFINLMLENVKIELEKEYIMHGIAASTSSKLTSLDYQSLHYILSMKGMKTVNDFASLYNRINDKRKLLDIYQSMIIPLLDKDVIRHVRDTNNNIYGTQSNFVFELNPSKLDNNPNKIKKLKL
ncbi:MAG: Fic family protein [Bacilli bacterium]|nr:Fic family protein [Bacilli bacterium]MDD4808494.1 Fic family protein [Bacilli bacterium]